LNLDSALISHFSKNKLISVSGSCFGAAVVGYKELKRPDLQLLHLGAGVWHYPGFDCHFNNKRVSMLINFRDVIIMLADEK